ncbi:MAG TPA: aldehyde dehydrogenase family protein, partial [Candidatus Dormibacteraeota bacterium]|nr:aldehyde dehydrogenase family protein [Candidatus Dormibacteraeota bacterium]
MSTANLFINGAWKPALEGGTREILNPANNEALAVVADGSARDAEQAIAAARTAFDEGPWPKMRAAERASYLFKLADAIDGRLDEL